MFRMDWKVKVGNYTLNMLESVEIVRSVEQLTDTATIKLPATAWNKALNIEQQIKHGDKVSIELGYDGQLVSEFDGYLDYISSDGAALALKCEDGILLYKVELKNKVMPGVRLKQLLAHVNAEVSAYYKNDAPFSLECDFDFKYDKFTIYNMTAYDVLKKVQEEVKPNVYLKGRVLHVHPQYREVFGKQYYNFSVNIETSDLKYRKAEDRRLHVTVESKTPKGKVLKAEAGTVGGDKLTLKIGGVTDLASLNKLAKQAWEQRIYTGYEGTFTGWLVPYCDAGWQVRIRDVEYPYKNGTYYVLEVKVEFGKSGGKRTVKLGKKLSDG